MRERPIDEHYQTAIVERIASSTIGIAVRDNKSVGTGTLIAHRSRRYVLTARHVVTGVDPTSIRFWCRPATPIREKSAKDVADAEIGKATVGELFPIQSAEENATLDIALL